MAKPRMHWVLIQNPEIHLKPNCMVLIDSVVAASISKIEQTSSEVSEILTLESLIVFVPQ